MISLLLAMIFTYTIRRRTAAADEQGISPFASRSVGVLSIALWFMVAWGGRWIGFGG
jgi:hypothetical protein